jgi:hypothetical protein
MRLGALIAPTAADIRDVIIEGPSGLLATAPPWCMPVFEPTKRRISWPNGARAVCLSGEEPERARGLNIDTLWADELACWQRAQQTWDMATLALRAGSDPRALVTTTPRRVDVLRRIMAEPTTAVTTESTHANAAHLPPEFLNQIIARFEGTRLGQQEIYAQILEVSEGAWFNRFDPAKHVTREAEFERFLPVHLAIDCGVSRHVGAVFFQTRQVGPYQHKVTVFGDYLREGAYSEQNARAIKAKAQELMGYGQIDTVRLDPASGARTGIGPAAFGEFARVFGERITGHAPRHTVTDGLDQIELLLDQGCLLIHPRCEHLKCAFLNYSRAQRGGEWLDQPADNQSPYEDMIDALRYGIRSRFPSGRVEPPNLHQIHASQIF